MNHMIRTQRTCTNVYHLSQESSLSQTSLTYSTKLIINVQLCNVSLTDFLWLQLCILVLGALGGRFDHEMGNINVLYRFSDTKIVLLSDDCSIFLLPKTHTHEIHIEKSVEGPHCGLIPIGGPSTSTTTTGLRWNLGKSIRPYNPLSCMVVCEHLIVMLRFPLQITPGWAMVDW